MRRLSAAGLVVSGALAVLATLASAAPGCNAGPEAMLRAKVIEDRSEVVGGPVSVADVGDFLLENDQIRVAILAARASPAPGIYGGSVVDIDRRRAQHGFEAGGGHDRFSETFPIANLLVPDPDSLEVNVLSDGTDGKTAAVRVEGDGEFLYEALAVLRNQAPILDTIFPDVRTSIHFITDYSLAPGDKFIKVHTELRITAKDDPACLGVPSSCTLECEHGYAQDANGCLTCDCSDALPLEVYESPHSVFGGILGDTPTITDPPAVHKAGVIAGDFVFFGNQNNVFAPGVGFDEDEAVQNAANLGQNTFTIPLTYDFVAAAGGDISYGYLTVPPEGQDSALVNVPIFASAATAFIVGGKQCSFDAADDESCDKHRAFAYDRYIVVGDGDIASVTEEMSRIRGDDLGEVSGFVRWASTAEPVPNAHVVVFADPDPERAFSSIDEVAAANVEQRGDVGVVNSIDADLGLDRLEDGDYRGALAPGAYVLVAMDANYQAVSAPAHVRVDAGASAGVSFSLPSLANVDYRVTDVEGEVMPAKLTFVALDADGAEVIGDRARRVYAGEGRITNGARLVELTPSGVGTVQIEPGRYRVYVSRGPEYGAHVEELELASGQTVRLDARLTHQVDTSGWLALDMHLHSAPSFDSGMAVPKRVTSVVAEGLDVAVSTDHDVSTDYGPFVTQLELEHQLKTFVSAEVTTLEYGHFIGFPLDYDNLDVPRHGSPDWSCLSGGEILDEIRNRGDGLVPFTVVAHPRDGFFGYIDQSGVDTFTLLRKLDTLNQSNPVLSTVSCDFDGMEAMGAKRFDLIRTPTVGEILDWTRCKDRLNAAQGESDLYASCPELGDGAIEACLAGETFEACKRRGRSRLAYVFTKRILERTHDEQENLFDFVGDEETSQFLCNPAQYGDNPIPESVRDQPCAYRAGQVDDFFRYLEYGLTPTQIGASDSHDGSKEPGFPRTYFKSETDKPIAVTASNVVESLRAGHAVASYGPFIRATIDDKTFGEVVRATPGEKKRLLVNVQTPDWFGADRLEIYENGHIVHEVDKDNGPEVIDDFKVDAPIVVPDRDSWVVIVAIGLRDENQMGPVIFDIPFGEIQLSQTASGAFADVPVVNMLLAATPTVPDWSPTIPYAITNPIYLDVDENGKYDAPNGPAPFCSRPCKTDDECPVGETCLGVCGIAIGGACTIPRTTPEAD
ncbi:MAG: PHP domain-containing protein [Polyangiaceae bacterium]